MAVMPYEPAPEDTPYLDLEEENANLRHALEMAQARHTVTLWIQLGEMRPAEHQRVLVWHPHRGVPVAAYFHRGQFWEALSPPADPIRAADFWTPMPDGPASARMRIEARLAPERAPTDETP